MRDGGMLSAPFFLGFPQNKSVIWAARPCTGPHTSFGKEKRGGDGHTPPEHADKAQGTATAVTKNLVLC